jgi:hypothetical protein
MIRKNGLQRKEYIPAETATLQSNTITEDCSLAIVSTDDDVIVLSSSGCKRMEVVGNQSESEDSIGLPFQSTTFRKILKHSHYSDGGERWKS